MTTPQTVKPSGVQLYAFAFGPATMGEIEVMLEASASSGSAPLAVSLLAKRAGNAFLSLTRAEAEYLRDNMRGDADRVAMGCSEALGRQFEKGADKIDKALNPQPLKLSGRMMSVSPKTSMGWVPGDALNIKSKGQSHD